MKTTEQIQEEYAKSKGYDIFDDLLLADTNAIDYHVSYVQKIYAQEVVSYIQDVLNAE